MHCFAGCTEAAIVAEIGLTLKDLFVGSDARNGQPHTDGKAISKPKSSSKAKGKRFDTEEAAVAALCRATKPTLGPPVGQWTYHDTSGKPIAVVLRFNIPPTEESPDGSKEFRPVSLHDDGGWYLKAPATPRPLYGLPALATASVAFVCEGEKAADATRSLGFIATTSMNGSQSAENSDWMPLVGKTVVILPDNDEAGRKYAEDVASILHRLDASTVVKIVELPGLPPKGDVVEWIKAQGDAADRKTMRADLQRLIDETDAIEHNIAQPRIDKDVQWPGSPAHDAYYGLVGDIVRKIEPHTEADPVALLIQLLVAVGNVIGRTAYFVAESQRHYLNLYVVLVGATAKGRKGSSWSQIERLMKRVDEPWTRDRIADGLSSGEGLIWYVRDPIMQQQAIKEKGRVVGYEQVETDPGVTDKRCLIMEAEYANVLKVTTRETNNLSAVVRKAWDTGDLRTLTKNSPAKATGAHISIIGHITRDELRRLLNTTEQTNGFGNRFLWLCVRRSKVLPEGGRIWEADFGAEQARLQAAIHFSQSCGELIRDDEARDIWHQVYEDLSEGKPGLLGGLLSRAESQVMRMAGIYAVLDQSHRITAAHLRAALALWRYCEASTKYAFGQTLGDRTADDILTALKASMPHGMTRLELNNYFRRNKLAADIERGLGLLCDANLAHCPPPESTGRGRPPERWFAGRGVTNETKETNNRPTSGF